MNTEQAIKTLEEMQRYREWVAQQNGAQCALYPRDFYAIDVAIAALRSQAERAVLAMTVDEDGYAYQNAQLKKERDAAVEDIKMIVLHSGDLPRIELFARQHAEGWDCWGNEV